MKIKLIGDAGAGKTSTIIGYAKSINAIILSHTRATIQAVRNRAPEIECSTLHSLSLNFPKFRSFSEKTLKIGVEKIRAEFCRRHGIPYSENPYIKKRGNVLFTAYSKLINTKYPDGDVSDFPKEVIDFANLYESFKIRNSFIDYEDMLKFLFDMAEKGEFTLGPVIVDEAQDLSPLQFRILDMATNFIIAAGDELQSIFSFHGAVPEIFAKMDAQSIILSKNYRIRENIWDFTEKIVERQLKRKRAKAVREGGAVHVLPPSGYKELATVIKSLPGKKMVLFRYNEDVMLMKALVENEEDTIIDTIHACKGHECSTVILVDGTEEERTEEEERVWYVGATRSKDHLIIVPFKVREPFLSYCYDFAIKADLKTVISENKRILSENMSLSDTLQKRKQTQSPPPQQVF